MSSRPAAEYTQSMMQGTSKVELVKRAIQCDRAASVLSRKKTLQEGKYGYDRNSESGASCYRYQDVHISAKQNI